MNNSIDFLLRPITQVPGVGEKTAKFFERLGIYSKFDLLCHFPIRIEKKLFFPDLSEVENGSKVVLSVEVLNVGSLPNRRRKIKVFRVNCSDGNVEVELIFFNLVPPYLLQKFVPGSNILISGKIERAGFNRYKIIHPNIHNSMNNITKNDVIYPLSAGLNSSMIQKYIKYILLNTQPVPEWLPQEILSKHGWDGWYESITQIHYSGNQNAFDPNSKWVFRLAFDELLANQLAIKIVRKHRSELKKGQCIKFMGQLKQRVVEEAGFKLTAGQNQAIKEIESDQASYNKMMRLLQGDVGCGKTLVALCSMLNVKESGMQSALMAPTEILAQQHFRVISNLIKNHDIIVRCLTGKTSRAKRKEIISELKSGKIDILIGTHALFQPDIVFNKLSLVVIDEQHRFGVRQRMELMNKAENSDVLVMSATPIPRTLAMSLYGDLDISTIKDKPAGRQQVKTLTISAAREDEIIKFIKNKLQNGEQVYWVCPLIQSNTEGVDVDSYSSVEDRYRLLKNYFGADVAIMHGKMLPDEKENVMAKFTEGKVKILISTTVIEVGVDVPNATLLVVEKAERFGLAQLHQLRGRVGRGSKESHCILMFSNNMGETSVARLKTLKESDDGFYIAEQDFKIRGGGEILGAKQSGLPEYKIADFKYHVDLLFEAGQLAEYIVSNNQERTQKYLELIKMFGYIEAKQYLRS